MARKDFYTIEATPEAFKVIKVNASFEHEQTYTVTRTGRDAGNCDCFAGLTGKFCRHKQMIPVFEAAGAFNTGRLYNHDKKQWREAPQKGALFDPDDMET